jgi:glycosyltransferase involved in cell wall biosynthesis
MTSRSVVYVHHSGSLGGAPRSLAALIARLDRTRYSPQIVMLKHGPAEGMMQATGAPVRFTTRLFGFNGGTGMGSSARIVLKNLVGAVSTILACRRSLNGLRPHIVHLNTTSLFLIARYARRHLPGVRIVCHVREPLLENVIAKLVRRMNERFIDVFVAIDRFTADRLAPRRTPCVVRYNPVDLGEFSKHARDRELHRELGLPAHAIIVTFLARIDPVNNVHGLCAMAERLCRDDPRFHFILAGFRPSPGAYEESIRAKVAVRGSHVHALEFREDAAAILAGTDILVSPFEVPHFARSVIEAAAMGVPSVASRIGSHAEIIRHGETGFLYGDEEEFRRYLRILADDAELRMKMGLEATRIARGIFDADRYAAEMQDLYDRLLDGRLADERGT